MANLKSKAILLCSALLLASCGSGETPPQSSKAPFPYEDGEARANLPSEYTFTYELMSTRSDSVTYPDTLSHKGDDYYVEYQGTSYLYLKNGDTWDFYTGASADALKKSDDPPYAEFDKLFEVKLLLGFTDYYSTYSDELTLAGKETIYGVECELYTDTYVLDEVTWEMSFWINPSNAMCYHYIDSGKGGGTADVLETATITNYATTGVTIPSVANS